MPTLSDLYARLHADQLPTATATADSPPDPIASFFAADDQTPPAARQGLAAAAFKAATGLDDPDGSVINPARTPLEPAAHYQRVRDIFERGTQSLNTPRLQEWLDTESELDAGPATPDAKASVRQRRLDLARANSPKWPQFAAAAGTAVSSAFATDRSVNDAYADKKRAEEDALLADYESRMLADNWLHQYQALKPRLSERAQRIAEAAAESGLGIGPEHYDAFRALPPEEAEAVSHLAFVSRPEAAPGVWRHARAGMRELAKRMGLNIYDAATNPLNRPEAPDPFALASGLYDPASSPAVSPEAHYAERRKTLLLRDANAFKPYSGQTFLEESFVGAFTTIPYMAIAAVPIYGIPAIAGEQFQNTYDLLIREGADPEASASSLWAAAFAYAYVERLSGLTAAGAPLTTLGRRAIFMRAQKEGLKGLAKRSWQAAAETLTIGALETAEEITQGGIEASAVARAAGRDAVAAAVTASVQNADTWLTMLGIGGFGTGIKNRAARRAQAGVSDLHELAVSELQAQTILDAAAGRAAPAPGELSTRDAAARALLAETRQTWRTALSDEAAVQAMQSTLGLSRSEAVTLADYYAHEAALSDMLVPADRARYRELAALDVPAMTALLPGATVETISPAAPAPQPTSAQPSKADISDFSDPAAFYRIIVGKPAYDDIVASGQVRTPAATTKPLTGKIDLSGRPTAFPSFSKGKVSIGYAHDNPDHYVISTKSGIMQPSRAGRHGRGTTQFPTGLDGRHLASLDASEVDVYRHDGNGKYTLVYSKGAEINVADIQTVAQNPATIQNAPASPTGPEPRPFINRKVNRAGRRVTIQTPNPAHAEWLAQRSVAPAPLPTATATATADSLSPAPAAPAYRVTIPVTLPDGTRADRSYEIRPDDTPPDTSSPEFAASVEAATAGAVTARRYLDMSPDARAATVNKWQLASRANASILAPDGTRATAEGLIRLVTRADTSAALQPATNLDLAHEHLHVATALARDAGALTPEHDAVLAEVFGPGTLPGERFNEERAAVGFSRWLAGQPDTQPKTAGVFEALRAFLERLLQALGLIPTPEARSQREAAIEAAYTAVRTGDWSGLSPYAGITFTAPASAASQAPSTLPTATATADSLPEATPAEVAAALTPEQTAANISLLITATQAGTISPTTVPTPPTSPTPSPLPTATANSPTPTPPAPAAVSVATPSGGLRFGAEWQAVPLDGLVTSDRPDYPQQFQPRNRDTVTSRVQILNIAKPGAFDPQRYFDSAESDGGSPITANAGIVLSGNGRTLALRLLADAGRFSEYESAARAFAAARGIPIPAGMRQPVLVRRVTAIPQGATLEKIAELSNRPKILQRSEAELAEADAKLLTPSLLALYAPGADGDLLAATNAPFMQAFARAAAAEGDLDSKGRPTDALALRTRNALLAAAVGTGEDARTLIRTLIERSAELGMRTLLNHLVDQSGPILALRDAKPALDLLPHLAAAVRAYVGWRTSGTKATLSDHLATADLLDGVTPPEQALLMTLAGEGRLGPALARYAQLARAVDTDTPDMFGQQPAPLPLLRQAAADTAQQPAATPATVTPPSPTQRSAAPAQPAPAPSKLPTAIATADSPKSPLPLPTATADFSPTPYAPTAIVAPADKPTWLSLGQAAKRLLTDAAEGLGKAWRDMIPNFQGGKRSLADRATAAITRAMPQAERDRVTHIVDLFGGGGAWGLFHAMQNFTRAERLTVNEFTAGRREKIRVFHDLGDRMPELLDRTLPHVAEIIAELDAIQKTSGSALGDRLEKLAEGSLKERLAADPDALGALYAIIDARSSKRASGKDEDGNKSAQAKYDEMRSAVIEQAANVKRMADAFRARGGTIEILPPQDSYAMPIAPSSSTFYIVDPPYYRTKGYQSKNEDAKDDQEATVTIDTYRKTNALIARIAASGSGMLYTDEAWWNKEDYAPPTSRNTERFGQLAEPLFGQNHDEEQQILLDILNAIDHFDVVDGQVGKRTEVMGVHHVHTTPDAPAESPRNRPAGDDDGRPAQRPDPAGRPDGDLQDPTLLGMASGDAGSPAPVRSGDDRLADTPRYSVTRAQSRPPLPGDPDEATQAAFGSWVADLSERRRIRGWRGFKPNRPVASDQPQGFGATEGEGIYVMRDRSDAEFFGTPIRLSFDMPKRSLLVDQDNASDPLPLLQEDEAVWNAIENEPESPSDTDWLRAHKRARARVGEWDSAAIAAALTEEILALGYDSLYVRSGEQEWAVLFRDQRVTLPGGIRYSVTAGQSKQPLNANAAYMRDWWKYYDSRGYFNHPPEKEEVEQAASRKDPDTGRMALELWSTIGFFEVNTDIETPSASTIALLEYIKSIPPSPTTPEGPLWRAMAFNSHDDREAFIKKLKIGQPITLERNIAAFTQEHPDTGFAADIASQFGEFTVWLKLTSSRTGRDTSFVYTHEQKRIVPGTEIVFLAGTTFRFDSRALYQSAPVIIGKEIAQDLSAPRFSVTAGSRPDTDALGFYSQLRALIAAKMPVRAPASLVRGLIDPAKGSGVKADEIQWSGLADFLDALPDDAVVTRDQVLAAAKDFELKETVLADTREAIEEEAGATQFSRYTIPGAKPGTYREILLQMPPPTLSKNGFAIVPDPEHDGYKAIRNPQGAIIETWMSDPEARERLATYGEVTRTDTFKSSHFQAYPNILAHARTDERDLPDGTPALFIEEIQSDWHQQGREKGYGDARAILIAKIRAEADQTKLPADVSDWSVSRLSRAGISRESLIEWANTGATTNFIPDAPYKDTSKGWARLMFKRLLRRAAEAGLPAVAWTDGATQADRYDLSKQVDSIQWTRLDDGRVQIHAVGKDTGTAVLDDNYAPSELPGVIGKALADRIAKDIESGVTEDTVTGQNLKVGGEGMREFYDRIIPRIADDLAKRYGAKTERASIGSAELSYENPYPAVHAVHLLRIPPAMASDILAGQPRFSVTAAAQSPRFSVTARAPRPPSSVAAYVEALTAARLLAGKPVTAAETAETLRSVGLPDEDPAALIAAAQARAQRIGPDPTKAAAALSDRDLLQRMASDADRERYLQRVERSFTAGAVAEAAGVDAAAHVQKAADRATRLAVESAAGYAAADMQAELCVDLSQAVLNTPDVQLTPDAIRQKLEEREAARLEAEAAELGADPATPPPDPIQNPAAQALLDQILEAARQRVDAASLEQQRKKLAASPGTADDPADASLPTAPADSPDSLPTATATAYRLIAPAITNPDEFAAFVYEWATRRIRADRPHLDPQRLYRDPAALRDLQRTAQQILRQLARDLLGTGQARLHAERDIVQIEHGRTPAAMLRDTAYVYSRIHAGALSVSRRTLIDDLVREAKRLAAEPGRFLPQREDHRRKVTAATEQWVRTLAEYVDLNPLQLVEEQDRLAQVIEQAAAQEQATGYPATGDVKFRKAIDQMAVLKEFGGLINRMPGQIAEASERILAHLAGERQRHEAERLATDEADAKASGALAAAVMGRDPAAPMPEPGRASRFADSLVGMLRLRLGLLIRNAPAGKTRAAAERVIADTMTTLAEAAAEYRSLTLDGQAALHKALTDIYGSAKAAAEHLDAPVPAATQAAVGKQGPALTYGRLIQLYASIIQRDYAENVRLHRRHLQLPAIRAALDARDMRLHQWLVGYYAANRAALSDAQKQVTGLGILSPDPFYLPVRMLLEPEGFRGRHAAWSPIAKALSPRVRNRRDFDESANVLDLFTDRLHDNALFIAYDWRGIRLRDTVASKNVLGAVQRYHGRHALAELRDQLEDTLRGGAQLTKDGADSAVINSVRRFTARVMLSGNLLSAAKQLAGLPAWSHAIGFRNFARYLTHIDPQAIRELKATPGYKARYQGGWSEEVANILTDPKRGPIAKAYDAGFIPIGLMDWAVSAWIGQGLYRDLKARHIDEGRTEDEAKRLAAAEVWSQVEETQQSSRTENLTRRQREGGAFIAAIYQFSTNPLQQMAYEIAAFREFKAGAPGSRAKLARTLVINHVLVPAILSAVTASFYALLGREPDDSDRKRMWIENVIAFIIGPFARVFLLGAYAERGLTSLFGGRPSFGGGILPIESSFRPLDRLFKALKDAALYGKDALGFGDFTGVTAADILADLHDLARSLSAPYRHASEAVQNRASGQ